MSGRTISVKRSKDLPHWTAHDGAYFLTFRLADSLPITARAGDRQKSSWREIDRELDRGIGGCILRRNGIADVVADSLRFFDRDRYQLLAWCLMPNHVHVVARIFGAEVPRVIHSWKSYTANEINTRLEKSGPVWQRDYFDSLLSDEGEIARMCRYVELNPESAGLSAWKHVWVSPEAPRID